MLGRGPEECHLLPMLRLIPVLATAFLTLQPGFALAGSATARPVQDDETEIEALVARERAEADLLRRRGDLGGALSITDDLLDEDEEDALTLAVRARVRLDQGQLERAESTAEEALAAARNDAERAEAGRALAEILVRTGRASEALERLDAARETAPYLEPGANPLDAWTFVRLRDALGDRETAERFARGGSATDPDPSDWKALLAKARCQRRAGPPHRRVSDARHC